MLPMPLDYLNYFLCFPRFFCIYSIILYKSCLCQCLLIKVAKGEAKKEEIAHFFAHSQRRMSGDGPAQHNSKYQLVV
jgi:hypothetical protein